MNADGPRESDVALRAARCGSVALLAIAFASAILSPRSNSFQSPAAAALRLDPNLATKHELMLLPDIGSATADAIIAARQLSDGTGAFASPADLDRVRHIGPRTIEKLRPHLRFATQSSE